MFFLLLLANKFIAPFFISRQYAYAFRHLGYRARPYHESLRCSCGRHRVQSRVYPERRGLGKYVQLGRQKPLTTDTFAPRANLLTNTKTHRLWAHHNRLPSHALHLKHHPIIPARAPAQRGARLPSQDCKLGRLHPLHQMGPLHKGLSLHRRPRQPAQVVQRRPAA